MTRPIKYLIVVLGFEDEKCCVNGALSCFQSGELFIRALRSVFFSVWSSLWCPSLAKRKTFPTLWGEEVNPRGPHSQTLA